MLSCGYKICFCGEHVKRRDDSCANFLFGDNVVNISLFCRADSGCVLFAPFFLDGCSALFCSNLVVHKERNCAFGRHNADYRVFSSVCDICSNGLRAKESKSCAVSLAANYGYLGCACICIIQILKQKLLQKLNRLILVEVLKMKML